jgi:diguanylate cyclase (GGDEF)-like protein
MINDINGHRFGDLVLQEVASRIRRFSQIEHIVGRFSGDEYVIAFIDDVQKSPNEWKTLINELMFTLKQPMFIEGKKVVINASLGYSTFPEHSLDAEELVMYSEMAMFEAKRNGKNQYKEFKLTMNEALQLQTEIDELLKIHDKSSVFTMVYQLIPIAVNFSCKQMMDIDYVLFLERLLKEYEVQPNELIIEITESIFMDTRYNGIDFINSFKKLGVTVALDDFGTGYSSLIYLTNINFDKVKLDRSFIHKLIDEKSVKVLSGIIHMLHSIDVTVVAEGVEDEIQSNTLLLCGCDELQGYYFGKPEKPERYQSN